MKIENRKPFGHRFNDLIGQRFGRLKVQKFAGFKGASAAWQCKCRCGRQTVITARPALRSHKIMRLYQQSLWPQSDARAHDVVRDPARFTLPALAQV